MNELNDLTPEQLEQILGTDYETVIADALRRKEGSEADPSPGRQAGQLANGHNYFDPGYAIEKYANRVRMAKEGKAAQGDLDKALAGQKQGRMTYANALLAKPQAQAPTAPPRTVDSAIPPTAPPPVTGAPPMAPGAPPALSNASQMPPDRLAAAGVPLDVQALLKKLRGG